MTTTGTLAWPTLDRVNQVLDALDDANTALDGLSIDCHGLIDNADPLEPHDGAPAPTLADVAALTVLCERLNDQLGNFAAWRGDFEQLRRSSAYLARGL